MPYSLDHTHIVVTEQDNGLTYALPPRGYAVLDTPVSNAFKITLVNTSGKLGYITSSLGISGTDPHSPTIVNRFDLSSRNTSVTLMFDTLNNFWQLVSKDLGDITVKASGSGAEPENSAFSFKNRILTIPQSFSHIAGYNNVRVTGDALNSSIAGYNTSVGIEALRDNFMGSQNVGVGHTALADNLDGSSNTAIGCYSLSFNVSGSNNVAVGSEALSQSKNGSENIAVGARSLWQTQAGGNVCVGYRSGQSNTYGNQNTFLGSNSGFSTTTGSNNTFIGANSGYYLTTGSNNVILGGATGLEIANLDNHVIISDGLGHSRIQIDDAGKTDIQGSLSVNGITVDPTFSTNSKNVFTKNQSTTPVALTNSATLNVDATLSNNFKITLTGNSFITNPTGLTDGMVLNFVIRQDLVGGRTLAFDSMFDFGLAGTPVLSTGPNKIDFVSCYFDGDSYKLLSTFRKSA